MTSSLSSTHNVASSNVVSGLAPVAGMVFLGFLSVSVPLAALAIEMRDHLGYGPVAIGWAIGLQALATLLTRHAAGTLCDNRGARRAVLLGLPLASASGVAFIAAATLAASPAVLLGCIVAGRLLTGLGESLFLTGLMNWGIARLGPPRTGKVMSWVGIAIYAALGLGAPAGLAVQDSYGFAGVGAVTLTMPLLAWLVALRLPPVPATGGGRVPFHRVLGLIWRPGLVLALATVPFAVIAAFLALLYASLGWTQAGSALFGFGAAYVAVRLLAGGLADKVGAVPVAVGSLALEAIGQAVLWQASTPAFAVAGATLTGLGFSLVFPAMGVLATRAVPAGMRGRAVGNFIAFADIAMGVTGPAAGLVVQWSGVSSAFGAGAAATVLALCLLPSLRPGRRA